MATNQFRKRPLALALALALVATGNDVIAADVQILTPPGGNFAVRDSASTLRMLINGTTGEVTIPYLTIGAQYTNPVCFLRGTGHPRPMHAGIGDRPSGPAGYSGTAGWCGDTRHAGHGRRSGAAGESGSAGCVGTQGAQGGIGAQGPQGVSVCRGHRALSACRARLELRARKA